MARTDLIPIDRTRPRFSQDSFVDAGGGTPEQWATVQDRNAEFARTHPNYNWDPYHIPWWEPWMGIALVGAGGAAGLGGFGGFGGGAGAGAGASAAGAGATGAGAGAGAGGAAGALPWANTLPIQAATSGQVAAGAGLGGSVAGTGGWLSTLGQVAGVPQGSGAGGWIRAGIDRIPQIAELARGAQGLESGRAAGRLAETNAANQYDTLDLLRTRTEYDRADQERQQREFAQKLQEASFKNAMRASLLQQARPGPNVSIPPELAAFQGRANTGTHIGDIPQATRDEMGGAMYRNSIQELLDPLQPGTATSGRRMAALPEPNPLSPRPEANGIDTALNTVSTVGTFLPAIYDLVRGPQRPPAPSTGVTPGIDLTRGPNPFAGGRSPSPSSTNLFDAGGQLPRIRPGTSGGGTPSGVIAPNVGLFTDSRAGGINLNRGPNPFAQPVAPYVPPPDQWDFMRGMRR